MINTDPTMGNFKGTSGKHQKRNIKLDGTNLLELQVSS